MVTRLAGIGVAMLLVSVLPARAEWVSIDLPTGAELKAAYEKPETAGTGHAVIYMHSRLVRADGYESAADRGYDVADFARTFARAGFHAIAPVRRVTAGGSNGDDAVDEGLSAILGAAAYLRRQKGVTHVSVAGLGEGALIALWALSQMPDLAKGVVMSPVRLTAGADRAASLNLENFIEGGAAKSIRAPVLLTVGERQNRAAQRNAREVSENLMKSYRRFWFIRNYPGTQRWFHQPNNPFMDDVIAFLKR